MDYGMEDNIDWEALRRRFERRPRSAPAPNHFMPPPYHRSRAYEIPHPQQGPPPRPPPSYTRQWTPPYSSAWNPDPGTPPPPPTPGMSHHTSPPRNPRRPRRRSQHRPSPNMDKWEETIPRHPRDPIYVIPIPMLPRDLRELPEDLIFSNRRDMYTRMITIFGPLVRAIGRIIKEELRLRDKPPVKFDMYPIRPNVDNERAAHPVIDELGKSRAAMFQITLPSFHYTPARLQEMIICLKDYILTTCPNPWYDQPGYIFRYSRRSRTEDRRSRRRFWFPPTYIWRRSRTRRGYCAYKIDPPIEEIYELTNLEGYRDTSDGDDDTPDETRAEEGARRGPYIISDW
ncbi:hypothetical protein K449DRAFT_449348 [Hypoxylon sp. EC38]|nr:hypothetical protein K449DRAFT_449348 [Hypoxylon sp. EC38]